MVKRISKTIKPYKLENGQTRYRFTIRIDSNHTTTRRGFYSIDEAEIAYINLRKKILDNDYNNHSGYVKFQEVYEAWLSSYKNTVKETTFYKTKSEFDNHILPFFADKYIKDINVDLCQNALNDWVSHLVHYKKMVNYTSLVFKEAVRRDYISKNPIDRLKVPKRTKHKDEQRKKYNDKNFYTIEEQENFLEVARKFSYEKYAFFRLLAYTGLRREEILPLKWKDLTDNMLIINKALVHIDNIGYRIQSTKNEEIRNLIIDPETIDVMTEWKNRQHNIITISNQQEQLIFCNHESKRHYGLQTPRRWQIAINDYIDLDHVVTLHGFRHTHGTLLLDNNPGLTMKDLQKRLGHRDLATTINTYLHSTNKSDNKMLKALNNLDKQSKKSVHSPSENS